MTERSQNKLRLDTRLGRLSEVGVSVWLDAIRREWLVSGELERLVAEDSVCGVTSNPTIFQSAILGSGDYDRRLRELAGEGADTTTIYETLAIEDVQAAADVLHSVYDRTSGHDGYVSMEVAPSLARDPDATIKAAHDLWARIDRPNLLIKIPGTRECAGAITEAISRGINVNVTLLFGVEQYACVADAYLAGLEARSKRGEPVDGIASVASFFVSRVDTLVDGRLDKKGESDLQGKAAVANARLAYGRFGEIMQSDRWKALERAGARPQRVLWASTSTKNPRYRDVLYVEDLVGPHVVNTMPTATLEAFRDHGEVRDALSGRASQAKETIDAIEAQGISMAEVERTLLDEGIEKFANSMDDLIAGIDRRRRSAVAGLPAGVEARLTDEQTEAVGGRVVRERERGLVRRVWAEDYTLWQAEPAEIVEPNRLGWLTVASKARGLVSELEEFAAEVAGFKYVCLMGMGGSSLAPIVLGDAFDAGTGHPRLVVLDSTHPDAVRAVTAEIDLDSTLFIVSSKSGTTLEPMTFYEYFRGLGVDPSRFVAVTDPGTALEETAEREGFRKAFLNDSDIGGRYSALSWVGTVPAAISGFPVADVLDRAEEAVRATMPAVAPSASAGLWLGTAIGEFSLAGRDKLTITADAPLETVGLWIEQLVAESTGKDGRGILPVAGESLGAPEVYGRDRTFLHISASGAADGSADKLARLAEAGHPVLVYPFDAAEDIGRIFFDMEFAVAVAGSLIGINAFNQPDVQHAKELTNATISAYVKSGGFPAEPSPVKSGPFTTFGGKSVEETMRDLLGCVSPGRYFAVLAYAPQTDPTDVALDALRLAVRDRFKVATTVGYGPRYLHSTGQFHKGGPPTGIFLEITCDAGVDVPISGAAYDFGALVKAQALGDFQALKSAGRDVVRVHISGDVADGLSRLATIAAESPGP